MGQEQYSCDTTQIDLRTSRKSTRFLRTVIHSPGITGGFPSAATEAILPVQTALKSPFAKPSCAVIPPPTALCGRSQCLTTTLSQRFLL